MSHTQFSLIHSEKHSQSAIPEEDPLLGQRSQGAPLSGEHLHQVRREPFTPLHVAGAHLLAGREGSVLRGSMVQMPLVLHSWRSPAGGKLGALPSRGHTSVHLWEQGFSKYASTDRGCSMSRNPKLGISDLFSIFWGGGGGI